MTRLPRLEAWRAWTWIVLGASVLGCWLPPSEERLSCLNDCARKKDSCMLAASNAPAVQQCDWVGQRCSEVCP